MTVWASPIKTGRTSILRKHFMTSKILQPRDRLIVGLDVPTIDDARAMVNTLGDTVSFYKIGMQQVFAGGLDLAQDLVDQGKQVFLDMKLLDIPNTVSKAIENIAKLGVTFTTVHAYDHVLLAAVEARGSSNLQILGVTVLTNLDDSDLERMGIGMTAGELVLTRAKTALNLGVDGVIASAHEASAIHSVVGDKLKIVTPGIRLAGGDAQDQKRVMTPSLAIKAGSDYLVVARPVIQAQDPQRAAALIIEEIANAA